VTSLINDGAAAIGAVYIHDLWLQPDFAYDEAINFDGNAGSNGTIENVRIHTVDFQTGMRINGAGWQIKDCYIEADDTALIIHADATEIMVSGLYAVGPAWDDYTVIINGDRNILTDSILGRGVHIVGDDNTIEGNTFAMRVATGAGSDDAITVSGDRNYITGNKVVEVSGTVLDGIDIKSGATGNIIGDNDLTDTTTPIRDDGTDTVLPPGVWRTWTPTYTDLTLGNGTVVAEYTRAEGLIVARFDLTFGTTTTVDGTDPRISMPVTAAAGYAAEDHIGPAGLLDFGTQRYPGQVRAWDTAEFNVIIFGAGGTYATTGEVSATVPFTWTTNDRLTFTATYEAA
jgi:hypothetical protein